MADLDPLTDRWREDLAAWRIPEEILAAARADPWELPRDHFVRRAAEQVAEPRGVTYERAREALPDGGSVLDVGAGGGAAGLPLADRAGSITAVDRDERLLATIRAAIPVRTVLGDWPDVAGEVEPADVVLCAHVLYNVPDVAPFLRALTDHARRRVVVELTDRHPMTPLNPLWTELHGIDRPDGPRAGDALAILDALGLHPTATRWDRPAQEQTSYEELVRVTAQRLCVPPDRLSDVERALRDHGVRPGGPLVLGPDRRDVVTIWWDAPAR